MWNALHLFTQFIYFLFFSGLTSSSDLMVILLFLFCWHHWAKQRKEVGGCYWQLDKVKFNQQCHLGMDYSLLGKLIPHPSDLQEGLL